MLAGTGVEESEDDDDWDEDADERELVSGVSSLDGSTLVGLSVTLSFSAFVVAEWTK